MIGLAGSRRRLAIVERRDDSEPGLNPGSHTVKECEMTSPSGPGRAIHKSSWIVAKDTYSFPDLPACYVISADGHIYVGSTNNIRKRMLQHDIRPSYGCEFITPWGICDKFILKYKLSVRFGDWLMWEARLIKRLRPALNVRGSKNRRRRWDFASLGTPRVKVLRKKYECVVFATVTQFLDPTVELVKGEK